MWNAVDLAFQHLSRYIVTSKGPLATPAMSLSVLFVWPSMYRGVYGRFLLSQLDTAGNVAVLNVALAFLGLGARVASRPEAGALLTRMYSDRAAAGAEASRSLGEVRAAKRYMDFLAEITGIVCAASVYTFGVVSRECLWKHLGVRQRRRRRRRRKKQGTTTAAMFLTNKPFRQPFDSLNNLILAEVHICAGGP